MGQRGEKDSDGGEGERKRKDGRERGNERKLDHIPLMRYGIGSLRDNPTNTVMLNSN